MLLDASLLNPQHYKVRIKGKMKQFHGKEEHPPQQLGVVAIEKGYLGHPGLRLPTLLYLFSF